MDFASLEQSVSDHASCQRTSAGFFSQIEYLPTGRPVRVGFRCFACSEAQLVAAFEAGGLVSVANLPFALDKDGRPQINRVRIELIYAESGGFVGAQPLRYSGYASAPAAAPLLLEGAAAEALSMLVRGLDQTASR